MAMIKGFCSKRSILIALVFLFMQILPVYAGLSVSADLSGTVSTSYSESNHAAVLKTTSDPDGEGDICKGTYSDCALCTTATLSEIDLSIHPKNETYPPLYERRETPAYSYIYKPPRSFS